MQYIYRSKHLVVRDGYVYVYKYEKCKFVQPFISFQAKNFFIGNSKICEMTEFSGAGDSPDCDGNTILLECGDKEYVYISGFEKSKFKTDEKIMDYISLMGNNMCPYAIMDEEEYTYFISYHYKFFENDKTEEGTLLSATNNNLDPFLYHLRNCGVDSFIELERSQIHSCWPHDDGEDENVEIEDDILVEEGEDLIERHYCNGSKELVKIFEEKCVLCGERDSIYAFRQCGHQFICEDCYQN